MGRETIEKCRHVADKVIIRAVLRRVISFEFEQSAAPMRPSSTDKRDPLLHFRTFSLFSFHFLPPFGS
jgi:hypothetical protein